MKHVIFYSVILSGLCILVATAQLTPDAPENLGDASPLAARGQFILRSVHVASVLTKEMILATPDWSPKEPLPISISNVLEIAEAEINRYATFQPVKYEVANVSIRNFRGTQNRKWYFTVSFNRLPEAAGNNPHILVDFAGHVGVLESDMDGRKKLELK